MGRAPYTDFYARFEDPEEVRTMGKIRRYGWYEEIRHDENRRRIIMTKRNNSTSKSFNYDKYLRGNLIDRSHAFRIFELLNKLLVRIRGTTTI